MAMDPGVIEKDYLRHRHPLNSRLPLLRAPNHPSLSATRIYLYPCRWSFFLFFNYGSKFL